MTRQANLNNLVGIPNLSFQDENKNGIAVLNITHLEDPLDHNMAEIESGIILSPSNLVDPTKLDSETSTPPGCWQPFWTSSQMGIIMAIASSFSFSVCSIVVKVMKTMHPIALATYRFLGLFLLSLPLMLYYKQNPFPKGMRVMLIIRSILGCSSLMSQFYALKNMPLGDATVITFSVPVFVAIFARIFLKERFTLMNGITILFTLAGCVLIARPPWIFGDMMPSVANATLSEIGSCSSGRDYVDVFEDEAVCFHKAFFGNCSEEIMGKDLQGAEKLDEEMYPNLFWGAIVAFTGTIFAANVYVVVRKLKGLHHSAIMTSFGFFALIQTFVITAILDIKYLLFDPSDWQWIVLLAVFSFFGQILLTMALQRENAGPVSIARSMTIIWAFLWQVLIFQERPVSLSLVGAGLVLVSVLLLAWRKWIESTPHDSKIRKRLKILLI